MKFNFKKYVKSLLVEDARSSNLAGYTEEAAYTNVNGVYVAKDLAKDPYSYSVDSNNNQEIVIRVESAPSNRQSAVGRKFKITKNNLDNPNVQLLYASIIADKPVYNLNVSGLKFSDINFETVIGNADFNFDNFFQEQFNKIIAVGKENASTTLKSPNKIFKLSTGQSGELLIKNQGDLTQFIAAIEKNIEKQYNVIVVALGIEVNDVQRIASPGPLNEQLALSDNNVSSIYVLMKRGALSYYKINFAPDISIFIEDNAMIETMKATDQPIDIDVTSLAGKKAFDRPEAEVVPDVVYAPSQGATTQDAVARVNNAPQPEAYSYMTPPGSITLLLEGSAIDAVPDNGKLKLILDNKQTKKYEAIITSTNSPSGPLDLKLYIKNLVGGSAVFSVEFDVLDNSASGGAFTVAVAGKNNTNPAQDVYCITSKPTLLGSSSSTWKVENILKTTVENKLKEKGFGSSLPDLLEINQNEDATLNKMASAASISGMKFILQAL